jgi:hypothetical protein
MSARLPDQFDQRGPLHTHVGGWMEQEAAKVPEPDGVPPQADGVPIQSGSGPINRMLRSYRLALQPMTFGSNRHVRLPEDSWMPGGITLGGMT